MHLSTLLGDFSPSLLLREKKKKNSLSVSIWSYAPYIFNSIGTVVSSTVGPFCK